MVSAMVDKFVILILGYLRITDLGIARVWRPDNAKDTSGTPGYMGIQKIYNMAT